MDNWLYFAPCILVIFVFFIQNKIFVTPAQMEQKFTNFEHQLEKKFVLETTYTQAIDAIKDDVSEMKEKLNKIYDMLLRS